MNLERFLIKILIGFVTKMAAGISRISQEICFCKVADLESALERSASCIYVLLFQANPAGWSPAS
jgi:hypothetical protein